MKQFLKFTLASCLGLFICFIIVGFLGTISIGLLASMGSAPQVNVKDKSVLEIELDKPIPEITNNIPVDFSDFRYEPILGLSDIVNTIQTAGDDDKIEGILLNLSMNSVGFASADVIRDALQEFREKGKFVAAYSEDFTEGMYYMSSAADRVFMNPNGMLEFNGFAVQIPYFKEMLDKLEIEMEVYYAGKFKGGSEPYRLTKMSDENRFQIKEFLNDIYDNFLDDIAESRGMTVDQLNALADKDVVKDAETALEDGLIDEIAYWDQVKEYFADKMDGDKDKINRIELVDYYLANKETSNFKIKDKIAVLYAEGTILDGKGENQQIASEDYMKMINKIRKDEKVKAVVLRVNSPGGSAKASDNILRELNLVKDEGKPVVVSMGNVAASGGYYISCQADKIYAEKNTITGSIGVYSMLPILENFMENKLGINYDSVSTGKNSLGINPFFDSSDNVAAALQGYTDKVYEQFLSRVAKGRNMSRDEVHEIAQGRVWTGVRAQENGLVDELGSLEDAIETAAELAGLDEYRLTNYPKLKEPFEQVLDEIMNPESKVKTALQAELGDFYTHFEQFRKIKEMKGDFMLMPYVFEFQ